ncbi:MAG TPA: MBL fold metallo-hydrolase [Fodinibius sp.]|nr:MBL fold metallo-hydrolase [Fodinibius sp.]
MTWIITGTVVFLVALFTVEFIIAAPPYSEKTSSHFNGKQFVNPNGLEEHHYFDVLKWWFSGNDKGSWYKLTEENLPESHQPKQLVSDGDLHVTFINHASFLIQLDGMNILTDPIWSKRASPFQWIGPKRMRPPGIRFDDLPPIDLVLISHNHYDHLDLQTVKKLHQRYDPTFVVPLGVERLLHEHHITRTVTLDWWEACNLDQDLSVTAVPARHFSGRGLFDRNQTLWCGYVLQTTLGNLYFAGDTGYGNFFEEIGQKFGPMTASFIPIGAYRPRWFMEPIHVSPNEAVFIHQEVQSERSFAMHFGTFPLADDGMFDAKRELQGILNNAPLLKQEFGLPAEGQTEVVTRKAIKV